MRDDPDSKTCSGPLKFTSKGLVRYIAHSGVFERGQDGTRFHMSDDTSL